MKNLIWVLTTIFILLNTSCRKKEEVTVEEAAISTSDASTFREESDQIINEASNYTENTGFGQNNSRVDSFADSVSVTAIDGNGGAKTAIAYLAQRKVVLTFQDSESKDGQRTRNGKVIIQLDTTGNKPKFWGDQNAELKITFENLRITRKSDSKFVVFNGTKVVKNTSGGRAIFAFVNSGNGTVTHEISGSVMVNFEDGTQRSWSISRRRQVEYQKITISSTRNDGVIEQGVNRFGTDFTTSINDPLVVKRLSCNSRNQARVTDGLLTHRVANRTNSIEFGFNSAGVKATTDCGKTSAKISYTNRRNQQSELILTLYRSL
ncbi:MAG: hypothetical protein SNJ77_04795 [Cytophagales bacterium]